MLALDHLYLVCYMLFAANLQPGEPTTLTAKTTGTLILTNVALVSPSKKATLYIKMPDQGEMVVVTLTDPTLTSYHTEIEIIMSAKQEQTLIARYGCACLLGKFVPEDSQFKNKPIDEVLKVKSGENVAEGKADKLQNELSASFRRQEDKSEEKLKQKSQVGIAFKRRSQRARNPFAPPKPQSKSKRQVNLASGSKSKGNSLLQMMYNLEEEDDDDESDEYSQEQQSSSSSSSSSSSEDEEDEDSDQSPKKGSKKEAKQQKIERKEDQQQSSNRLAKNIDTFKERIGTESKRVINKNVQKPFQKGIDKKQQTQQEAEPLYGSFEFQIQSIQTDFTYKIRKKVLQQLPSRPKQSKKDDSDNYSSTISQEEANWLKKYRKCLSLIERHIDSIDIKTQEASITSEQTIKRTDKSIDRRAKSAVQQRDDSSRRQPSRRGEGQQQSLYQKKEIKQGESSFVYPLPTVLPDFVLRK